jgi:16S rRNA G966 N2-methylase RsmD
MLDRVKESLFSVLEGYGRIRGQVLDLYAGTGSIGIEFLSRGAQGADFVEQSAHVCSIIKANLIHTHLVAYGHIYTMPVERFLLSRRGRGCYDYIMMDHLTLIRQSSRPSVSLLQQALAGSGAS